MLVWAGRRACEHTGPWVGRLVGVGQDNAKSPSGIPGGRRCWWHDPRTAIAVLIGPCGVFNGQGGLVGVRAPVLEGPLCRPSGHRIALTAAIGTAAMGQWKTYVGGPLALTIPGAEVPSVRTQNIVLPSVQSSLTARKPLQGRPSRSCLLAGGGQRVRRWEASSPGP